jgi:hypothetical protein
LLVGADAVNAQQEHQGLKTGIRVGGESRHWKFRKCPAPRERSAVRTTPAEGVNVNILSLSV